MKRLTEIRVLGKRLRIVEVPDSARATAACADYDAMKVTIRVDPVAEGDGLWQDIFHELYHEVNESMSLRLKDGQVNQLATVLISILRENPKLQAQLNAEKER